MRVLGFLFCLLAFSGPALARDCNASSVDARQVGTDDYDPNDLSQAVVRLSLRLTDECDLGNLRIVPRDSNVFVLRSANTVLLSVQADGPEVQASTTSAFVITPPALSALEDGEELAFDFLRMEPGQFVQAGNYQTTIDFISRGQVVGTSVINVLVSPTVRLLGDAEDGNIDLDLGRLNDGASSRRSVFFRSNAHVTLLITSDNGGALVHERGQQLGSIPYASQLNGTPINLGSPVTVPVTSVSGQLTEALVGVEVAPVRSAFAGIYRDVITLSFTAQ